MTCENYGEHVLGLRPDDVHFSTTKLFHAYGLGNALSFPLWVGATSVLMQGRPSRRRSWRPCAAIGRPCSSGARAVRRAVREADAEGALYSVRLCVSAAEPLPPTTIAPLTRRFGLDILDGIGSTEMLHIYCSNRPDEVRPGTTGWPVPGYELQLARRRWRGRSRARASGAVGQGRLVRGPLLGPA